MTNPLEQVFSPDYFTARSRFRQLAESAGCRLEAHAIDARGPDDELLTIDVALYGVENGKPALVISSGLHGVEGFFGSAVQLQLLRTMKHDAIFEDVGIVLLHALNPYGFAWLRRVNEDNIDLNRNFLLPGQPYEGSPPGYAELDKLINPQRPPSRLEPFRSKALWTILRQGMQPLKQAVAGGQYEFPRGLFFGGNRPSKTLEILRDQLPAWVTNFRPVLHLDFHTGLGKWATYKLLVENQLAQAEKELLESHFGCENIEVCDVQGVAYQIRGGMGTWCLNQIQNQSYSFLGVEFGTNGPLKVVAGLRAENQAHHWAKSGARCTIRAKRQLKELFCPASASWRARVLDRCDKIIASSIYLLQSASTTKSPTSDVE